MLYINTCVCPAAYFTFIDKMFSIILKRIIFQFEELIFKWQKQNCIASIRHHQQKGFRILPWSFKLLERYD